ncbi:MAG: hypothetical protein J5786_02115, partial [Clostridiales bacterium]|nr:hypothetical protein [Clostridiales bacterium]
MEETENKEVVLEEKSVVAAKKDPFIPVCIIAIILVIASASAYFIYPVLKYKSFGMTMTTLRTDYLNTRIYAELMYHFNNMSIPKEKYIYNHDDLKDNNIPEDLNFFSVTVNETFGTALIGTTRKSDDQITQLKALIRYDEAPEGLTDVASLINCYFGSFLELFDMDMSKDDAIKRADELTKDIDSKTNETDVGKAH